MHAVCIVDASIEWKYIPKRWNGRWMAKMVGGECGYKNLP